MGSFGFSASVGTRGLRRARMGMDGLAGVRAAGHAGGVPAFAELPGSLRLSGSFGILTSQAVRRSEPILAMREGGNETLTMAS